MSAENKAKELIELFYNGVRNKHQKEYSIHTAKKSAIICVNQILKTYSSPHDDDQIEEWLSVKAQIIGYEGN